MAPEWMETGAWSPWSGDYPVRKVPRDLIGVVQALHQSMGRRGLLRRAQYLLRLRTGVLRGQLPAAPNFADAPRIGWAHRFDIDELRFRPPQPHRDRGVFRLVDEALQGRQRLYGGRPVEVGWPPHWHRNAFTGHAYPREHWSRIADNDPEAGDIKDVWEVSRLGFTSLFAEAYLASGEDRYPEAWWVALEDWVEHNPPNTGANWRCGQESSLRGIAVCFGLSVFGAHSASTPPRIELAERLLGATVERVRPTTGYALSQRNNHAVSELVFLLAVVGPERPLCRWMLEVLDDQFYPDGSYSQQSFTYQRLAVQALQWLLVVRGDLPPGLRGRTVAAVACSRDFLDRCRDPVSGWLPNYGANDGALLFRFDEAHYRDFRPFLAALGAYAEPSAEARWLSVPEVTVTRSDVEESASTYVTLKGPRSLLLTRIGQGRHRPGHADQQAVDLWIDGQNLIADPGSYRYTALPPWGNALLHLEVHSTLRGADETVTSFGRFLRATMPSAEVVRHSRSQDGEAVVTRRQAGSAWLWRAILRQGDSYTVIDFSEGAETVIHWNLPFVEGLTIEIATLAEVIECVRDDQRPGSGWVSEVYGEREPVRALSVSLSQSGAAVLVAKRQGESSGALARWGEVAYSTMPVEVKGCVRALESELGACE